MPMDEQHVHYATAIYKYLPEETRKVTFAIPMYMEYLTSTKLEQYWETALVRGLYDSKKLLGVLTEEDNYILIGNAPKDIKFDFICNFQDNDKTETYKDVFLEKCRQIFGTEEKNISDLIYNLYEDKDSQIALKDCSATANFLQGILSSGALRDIEEIKQEGEQIKNGKRVQ